LKILTRHEKWTRSVAFQPKGSILASCGDDRSIKLWSIYSNEDPEILEGHSNTVRSIAFSPDGQTLISCSDDKNLKLWSVADRNCLKTFEGHEARVWSVSFGSNSDCFASASDDGTIRIWDAKQEKPPLTLRGATKQLRSVAFSPDGLTLISAGDAEIIELWDVSKAIKHWDNEAARLIRVLSGHSDWVRTVAFSSDSQCFCTGSQDWHIMLWNIEKGKVGDFIEKPYDKMNITEVTGISEAQASELRVLGAIYSPT
jgi:WD40 repeat protein